VARALSWTPLGKLTTILQTPPDPQRAGKREEHFFQVLFLSAASASAFSALSGQRLDSWRL